MKSIDTLKSVVRFGRIETAPVERRLGRGLADLRRIARRRLPAEGGPT